MHTIMHCTTASSTDAGRRPPSVTTFTIPTRSPKTIHIAADDLKAVLDVQVIHTARNTPVATSPVPMNALKRVDAAKGLAILNRRKALPAQEDLIFAGSSSIERVRTLNRLEALAKLEGRISCPAQEDLVLAESPVSSLKRVKTINKRAGLDILARRESRKARLFGGPILQAYLRP